MKKIDFECRCDYIHKIILITIPYKYNESPQHIFVARLNSGMDFDVVKVIRSTWRHFKEIPLSKTDYLYDISDEELAGLML